MTCSLCLWRILVLPEEREGREKGRKEKEEGKVSTKFQHSFLCYQLYVHVSYIPFFYFILSSSSCLDLDCLLRKESLSTSSSFPQPSSSWYGRLFLLFLPVSCGRHPLSLLLFLWCPERMLSKSLQREKRSETKNECRAERSKERCEQLSRHTYPRREEKLIKNDLRAPEEVQQPKLMEEKDSRGGKEMKEKSRALSIYSNWSRKEIFLLDEDVCTSEDRDKMPVFFLSSEVSPWQTFFLSFFFLDSYFFLL